MNASNIKARTVVNNSQPVTRTETMGAQFMIPAMGGALLAVAFHVSAGMVGAQGGIRFLAALAGVSGWLYVGIGFQTQRFGAMVAGMAAAAALFAAALLAVHQAPAAVGALFLIQAAIGVIAVAMNRRSPALIAWVSLNAVLGLLTVV